MADLTNQQRIRLLVASDLYRYAGKVTATVFLRQVVTNRSFIYSFWFRLCGAHGLIRYVAMVMHRLLSNRYGIQIPMSARVGYGLYIGHHMSVVINPTAVLGHNCNISQFTTIGSNHNRAAQIGNNVYIGPNVCIVEGVIIGDNVTIGAGSVVVKDIPSNATVAGNPAKVISIKQPGRYIQNPWPGICNAPIS